MRYWKVARARKQSGAALKRGRGGGQEKEREKSKKKKEKRKREGGKERKEKKIVSRVHVGCSAPFIRHMSRRDIERPTRKRGTERESENKRKREGEEEEGSAAGVRLVSRRYRTMGPSHFDNPPVTRSSRDRIAGGGNFLASTPWRRREGGEVCRRQRREG